MKKKLNQFAELYREMVELKMESPKLSPGRKPCEEDEPESPVSHAIKPLNSPFRTPQIWIEPVSSRKCSPIRSPIVNLAVLESPSLMLNLDGWQV